VPASYRLTFYHTKKKSQRLFHKKTINPTLFPKAKKQKNPIRGLLKIRQQGSRILTYVLRAMRAYQTILKLSKHPILGFYTKHRFIANRQ
jgi:hypothetical protein